MYRLGVQLSDLTNYCIAKDPFVILKLFDFLIYFVITATGGGLVLVLSVLVSLVSVPPTLGLDTDVNFSYHHQFGKKSTKKISC